MIFVKIGIEFLLMGLTLLLWKSLLVTTQFFGMRRFYWKEFIFWLVCTAGIGFCGFGLWKVL